MMRNKAFSTLLILIAIFTLASLIIYSCQHDAIKKDEIRKIYFDTEVLPVILNNCTASGCHYGNGDVFPLTTYDEIAKNVTKNNPTSSRLYQAITSSISTMPPNKPLNAQQRTIIYLWIDQGAENNKDTSTAKKDTSKKTKDSVLSVTKYPVCFSRDIFPILKLNCAISGCHDGQNGELFALSNYINIKQQVVAGNPQNSRLYEAITNSGREQMPPSPRSKLAQANIDSIYAWIKNGAADQTCPEICDTNNYKFNANIAPIINSYCVSCHNANASSVYKYINLSDYAHISTVATSGKLIGVLKKTGSYPQMPQNGRLPDCNITQIDNWIKAGTLNN